MWNYYVGRISFLLLKIFLNFQLKNWVKLKVDFNELFIIILYHFRLGPKNAHQRPVTVIFCGEHRQGMAGMSTARQLLCHNVNVIVHFVETARTALDRTIAEELLLLKAFSVKIISSMKGDLLFIVIYVEKTSILWKNNYNYYVLTFINLCVQDSVELTNFIEFFFRNKV